MFVAAALAVLRRASRIGHLVAHCQRHVVNHHLSAQKRRATALERAPFLSPFLRIPLMPSATPGDDTAGLTQQRPKLKASNARTTSPPPLRLECTRSPRKHMYYSLHGIYSCQVTHLMRRDRGNVPRSSALLHIQH